MTLSFYFLLLSCGIHVIQCAYYDIQTTTGLVRGEITRSTALKNKSIYAWKSIPYAEPPVGNLRFEPPVPKAPWKGVLDVRPTMNSCIQGSDEITGSEDCLYMKIFTTKNPREAKNLPVLVWIHGGAWWGGMVDFDAVGVDHLLNQDVIVVGLHYRLGPYGFLTTGDKVVPGNNGLKDQILALKWIHANIKNFGGDPNKITLAGQSAGSASIGYILQYPGARGLFSRVIMMSGDPLSLWSKCQAGAEIARQTAKNLKLRFNSTQDLVHQLKKADAKSLQKAAMSCRNSYLLGNNPRDGLVFVPVIEPEHPGAVVTQKSYAQLEKGNFTHVPIMAGFTSYELNFDDLSWLFKAYLLKYDVNVAQLAPSNLNANSINRFRAALRIKSRYFGLSTVSGSPVKTSLFISDDQFMKPITKAVELYSARVPVYFYQFSYIGLLGGKNNTKRIGPQHTEDLAYLKDYPFHGAPHDYVVKNRMVRMWTNFAKTGNPTPIKDPLLNNIIWPANRGHNPLKCMDINKELKVIDSPNDDNMEFWEELYRKFGRPPFDTY